MVGSSMQSSMHVISRIVDLRTIRAHHGTHSELLGCSLGRQVIFAAAVCHIQVPAAIELAYILLYHS